MFLQRSLIRRLLMIGWKESSKYYENRTLLSCDKYPLPLYRFFLPYVKVLFVFKSTSSNCHNGLSSSSVFLQNGIDIEELPLIVQKTNNIMIGDTQTLKTDIISDDKHFKDDKDFKLETILKLNINSCNSLQEIFHYLELLPSEEVTTSVALTLLERIFEFFTLNKQFTQDFTSSAVISKLCELICTSRDNSVLLSSLQTIMNNSIVIQQKDYFQIILQELLYRAAERKIKLNELCELVEILKQVGNEQLNIDKLWSNIIDCASEVNETNILKLYNILPCFKQSQKILLNFLYEQTRLCIAKLSGTQVAQILKIQYNINQKLRKLITLLSSWTNLNIHTLSEEELKDATNYMKFLDYYDKNFQNTLEKYLKAKISKLHNPELPCAISNYCFHFQLQSKQILNALSVYFVNNVKRLNPDDIYTLVKIHGFLNYHPINSYEFFKTLEYILNEKFFDFDPPIIIDILLSCIYLQRYPLNFTRKIFNSWFLDKINGISSYQDLNRAYSKLELLDSSLFLECPQYGGPFLCSSLSTKSLPKDGRLFRVKSKLNEDFTILLNGSDKFLSWNRLPGLPLLEAFVIDYVIHFDTNEVALPYNSIAGIKRRVAVIIHMPEHYCLDSNNLIGPQATKIRHLKLLNFQVAELNYSTLEKLYSSPRERLKYLKSKVLLPYTAQDNL